MKLRRGRLFRKRKTVGLALGSGGLKGLAHIGVIRTLEKHGVPIDIIAGASIGAWVGAHYALFRDSSRLREFSIDRRLDLLGSLFEFTLKGGLIKGAKVEKLLDEWLGKACFADTSIPLSVVATELVTGEEVVLNRGRLSSAVRASIAVPSIFSPIHLEGKILIDGGVSNPVPVSVARSMGADIVIAVNLNNFRVDGLFRRSDTSSIPKISARSIDLLRHYLAEHCIAGADVIIDPRNAAGDISRWKNYFLKEVGPVHMELGERSTEEQISLIKRLL